MIGICVAVRDGLEFTKQLYDCVERHTTEPHYWVFTDDLSDDGTAEWLVANQGVAYLRNPEPLGYTLSMNRTLKAAATYGPEALVVINNDILLSYQCLDELLGVIRHKGLWCASPGLLLHGCGYDEHSDWHIWERENRQRLVRDVERDFLLGACFMLSSIAYETLGGFDEAYAPYWFEDEDYAEKLCEVGHPPVMTWLGFLYHYENKTLGNRPVAERHETWIKNSAYFAKKWGHTP